MVHWKWTTVALVTLTTLGCEVPPQYPPALQETNAPLAGYFIGIVSITTANSEDKPVQASGNISVAFYDGEYTVTGDDDIVASSSGRYGAGDQFQMRDDQSDRKGGADPKALNGLFDYRWREGILVLEQWDATRDRLTRVFLQRTAKASGLLPYGTQNANAVSPPFGPPG